MQAVQSKWLTTSSALVASEVMIWIGFFAGAHGSSNSATNRLNWVMSL